MRVPSSLRLVIATWIAAVFGALAGGALAEASRGGAPMSQPGPSAPRSAADAPGALGTFAAPGAASR